jgi:hypothetical protein
MPAITETVMPAQQHAAELPRLDAFDEEFGQDPVAILRAQRRQARMRTWTLIVLAMVAGLIGALALAWSTFGDRLRVALQAAPPSLQSATRQEPNEDVVRLLRQVDELRSEIRDLTQARQQAADTIAALEAAAQATPSPPPAAYWYSDPAALTFGVEDRSQPDPVVLPPRRPAIARPAPRTIQPRDTRVPSPPAPRQP